MFIALNKQGYCCLEAGFQEQVIEFAFLVCLSCEFACLVANSEIDIASARGSDCAASILVKSEAGEGVGIGRIAYLAWEFGGEKRQGGAGEDGLVRCDTSVSDDRLIQTAVRAALFCLPEEYETRINLGILAD